MRISKLATAALAAGFLALTAGSAGATAVSASAVTGDATVTIVHGIPNTPVDVYANGKKILSGFTFKTVAGPLQLPPGSYAIAVRKAGSAASSAAVLSATEQVTAGENATVVAGLTASGTPVLSAFANDTSAAGTGKGRLVVRHDADAPAVDVYAGSSKVISGLASGQQQALDVAAGTVPAKVTLAGQTAAVLGPVNVPVTAGMGTVVYAIGSAAGHTLTAVTQQYPLGGAPSSAQAGSGGLGADPETPVWPFVAIGAVGLALIATGAVGAARRRRA
jgi:molybdopterin-binding protein